LVEKGQKPVATVISCSDSRVPVEVIFNQLRPGTFFVIRVAGNIISDSIVKGSIEYAVMHLRTPYIIILGHTECGAIKASLDGVDKMHLRTPYIIILGHTECGAIKASLDGVDKGEVGRLVSNIKLESKEFSIVSKKL
jgi:carbonic anhydrase